MHVRRNSPWDCRWDTLIGSPKSPRCPRSIEKSIETCLKVQYMEFHICLFHLLISYVIISLFLSKVWTQPLGLIDTYPHLARARSPSSPGCRWRCQKQYRSPSQSASPEWICEAGLMCLMSHWVLSELNRKRVSSSTGSGREQRYCLKSEEIFAFHSFHTSFYVPA